MKNVEFEAVMKKVIEEVKNNGYTRNYRKSDRLDGA